MALLDRHPSGIPGDLPPMIGTTLSHFEVQSKLGAGGMGEVYRAVDSRLHREVAVKLLPNHMSSDSKWLARFEREAKALASVNHPNIAAIYEIGQTDVESGRSVPFIVMELVEGETLEERLANGPLPFRQAVDIALSLTEALEAAHAKGIVHRDLKPANIKAAEDGPVKVLDFGIARLWQESPALRWDGVDTMHLELNDLKTQPGIVFGTATYMSPEQARGKQVDSRTDVWAWACVFWEMLTGKMLFSGTTVGAVIDSVLGDEPDWSALPADTPAGVVRLLRRCLQKDRKLRMRDMGDLRLALLDALEDHATVPMTARDGASLRPGARADISSSRGTVQRAAIAVVLAGIILAAWWLGGAALPEAPSQPSLRFSVEPPPDVTHIENPVLSSDGRLLAYLGSTGQNRLYLRDLGSFQTTRVPGSEGARNLFFSADDRWLFFFSRGKLRKISVRGGNAIEICDVGPDSPGGGLGPNNTVLYSPGWLTGIYQVSADGGVPEKFSLPRPEDGEAGHFWPELLPGERYVLFTIWVAGSGLNDAKIGRLDLKTGEHQALFPGSFPRYVSTGHLIYYHAGFYYAVRFDPSAGLAFGEPRLLSDDIANLHPEGSTFKPLSVSRSGTLAFIPKPTGTVTLSWVDAEGREEPWPFEPLPLSDLDLSPDGRLLVASSLERGSSEITVLDPSSRTESKLPLDGYNSNPRWHPSGNRLAYTSLRKGSFDIYSRSLDVGQAEEVVLDSSNDTTVREWTRSGNELLFLTYDYEAGENFLALVRPGHGQDYEVVVESDGDLGYASISPDGRWLAYGAAEEGGWEAYVQPFNRQGQRVKVSVEGGSQPLWSANKNELYYRQGGQIMVVRFRESARGFEVVDTERLFEMSALSAHSGWSWDVGPDGRFVVAKSTEEEDPRVKVVTGWAEELAQSLENR